MTVFKSSAQFNQDAALIVFTEEQLKKKALAFKNKNVENWIAGVVKSGQFTAEAGQFYPILYNKTLIVLVGAGKEKDFSLTNLRIVVRKALLSHYLAKSTDIEIIGHNQEDSTIIALIEAHQIGTYAWRKYKTTPKGEKRYENKKVSIVATKKKLFEDCLTICQGTNLTRDLINENSDVKNSVYLEKVVRGLIKGKKNIRLELLNRKEMQKKGLGLHLAVNQGSENEPKLIIVKYTGAPRSKDYTAVIGKGMTFDTGGLNLKPTGHMETMRIDMSGAAAVIGILANTLKLNIKKNILFVMAIAENTIDAKSYKPGDVFTSYSGKTVEILNTDAEGRLVLADAISYTIKNYKPARLIDMATLTGACVVALGHDYTGLVTNNDEISRQLVHSSNATDDRVWRLPIYPEIKDAVKSQIADIKNVGFGKGAAGALTAAEFLHQFTEGVPWAHLDIAGTSFVDGQNRWYYSHGATGAGVRLLTHYFMHQ